MKVDACGIALLLSGRTGASGIHTGLVKAAGVVARAAVLGVGVGRDADIAADPLGRGAVSDTGSGGTEA